MKLKNLAENVERMLLHMSGDVEIFVGHNDPEGIMKVAPIEQFSVGFTKKCEDGSYDFRVGDWDEEKDYHNGDTVVLWP